MLVRFHFAVLSIFYSLYHFTKCREVCFSLPALFDSFFMADMKQCVMRDMRRFFVFIRTDKSKLTCRIVSQCRTLMIRSVFGVLLRSILFFIRFFMNFTPPTSFNIKTIYVARVAYLREEQENLSLLFLSA